MTRNLTDLHLRQLTLNWRKGLSAGVVGICQFSQHWKAIAGYLCMGVKIARGEDKGCPTLWQGH